ncbi:MAG: hypothetical protein Q9213_001736 [Squamulea squamosa]
MLTNCQAFRHFFQLPTELRQQIYASYFDYVPVTYPNLHPPLLLSSPSLYTDAFPVWRRLWPEAHIRFKDTKHFLDLFTSITRSTLCKLRHVSVVAGPVPLYPEPFKLGYVGTAASDLADILPLFPSLQLSTLTVYDPFYGYTYKREDYAYPSNAAHLTVDWLVGSQGWKELIFVAPRHRLLQYFSTPPVAQPSTWDAIIKQKDGVHSGACVQMFQLDKDQRRVPVSFGPHYTCGRIFSSEQWQDTIEIRITRGQDARYVAENDSGRTFISGLFECWSWRDIQEDGMLLDGEDDITN